MFRRPAVSRRDNDHTAPWWKNSRGELFVLCQFALFALIILGPQTLPFLPPWSSGWRIIGKYVGACLMITGTLLAATGSFNLGRNLTPFICPKPRGVLLEHGAYRLVRHPIYSGILQLASGWGLLNHSWLILAYTLLLLLLFTIKSRKEEELLRQLFPGYRDYARRVRRLIPFI